jgi:hypothetical protein
MIDKVANMAGQKVIVHAALFGVFLKLNAGSLQGKDYKKWDIRLLPDVPPCSWLIRFVSYY